MQDIDDLIAGFHRFVDGRAAGGQGASVVAHPVMVICCADLEMDPAQLTGAAPGRLYVLRNLAGIVPPYAAESGARDFAAALEFGVRRLDIRNIIVLGHAGCGALGALLDAGNSPSDDPVDGEFMPAWLALAVPAVARAMHPTVAAGQRARVCEQETVRLSLENLMSYPWLLERVLSGRVRLHGWHADTGCGALHRLDPETDAFRRA